MSAVENLHLGTVEPPLIYPNTIILRPALGYDVRSQEARNNLLAFSPDIVPMFRANVTTDIDLLVDSYPRFISQSLQSEELNNIYVRGRVINPKRAAHTDVVLSAVTNELILWPQVINAAKTIGRISLSYDPARSHESDGGVVTSTKHIVHTPPGRGGRHDTLLARACSPMSKDHLEIPISKNWKQLCDEVGNDVYRSFYNTVVADPIFDVYSSTTRLRFFDDGSVAVPVELDVECLGIPKGFEFSLYSEDPNIRINRTPIVPGHSFGITVDLVDGFDTLLTLHIYNKGGRSLPKHSSLSLVAHVRSQEGAMAHSTIIGAEHILFHSASRYARGVRRLDQRAAAAAAAGSDKPDFWFRTKLGDTDSFPRTGDVYRSPDIQPVGQTKDLQVASDLGGDKYSEDYSSKNGVNLHTDDSNYIYIRANCSKALSKEISLYAIPNSLVLYPEVYGTYPVMETDKDDKKVTAVRVLKSTQAGPFVATDPFNLFNPPEPKSVKAGSDHYCLIGEARNSSSDPWPHDEPIAKTSTDFVKWLLNNPFITQRNVSWCRDLTTATLSWQVNLSISDDFDSTDQFTIKLSWVDMPVGGSIQMTTTGKEDLDIKKTTINQKTLSISKDFTGIETPWSVTVTISWWQENGEQRTINSKITPSLELREEDGYAKSEKVEKATRDRGLFVGKAYPNLQDNASNLHSRHPHLVGHRLLGAAFPIAELPHAGAYKETPKSFSKITRKRVLGADTQGSYKG